MSRPVYEIVREIRRDWKNVYFGAVNARAIKAELKGMLK